MTIEKVVNLAKTHLMIEFYADSDECARVELKGDRGID